MHPQRTRRRCLALAAASQFDANGGLSQREEFHRGTAARDHSISAGPRPDPNPENQKFVGLLVAAPRRAIRANAAPALQRLARGDV